MMTVQFQGQKSKDFSYRWQGISQIRIESMNFGGLPIYAVKSAKYDWHRLNPDSEMGMAAI
jgi:hypothetical protein